MPDIEIISLRLNLEKDDDRRLFELLQKRVSQVDQSRNEFLKHLLLDCLLELSAEKPAARPSKEQQPCQPAGKPSGRSAPDVPGPDSNSVISPEYRSNPVDSPVPSGTSREDGDNHREFDAETAALVASFVS
jgi:hypothetical protein